MTMMTMWVDMLALGLMIASGLLFWHMERSSLRRPGNRRRETLEGEPQRGLYLRGLRQAGLHPRQAYRVFWAVKFTLALLAGLLILEWTDGTQPVTVVTCVLTAGFVPDLWLLLRRHQRRQRIRQSLPFLISLIVAYLRFGVPLTQALSQVARLRPDSQDPLGQEMELISREINAGRDRNVAFSHLAARTGVPATERLAAVLRVGHEAGAPIADTLDAQARLLGHEQAQQVTELTQRKSMELMLPMELVCFPMFLVLVMFPAAIQLMDVLGMIGELF